LNIKPSGYPKRRVFPDKGYSAASSGGSTSSSRIDSAAASLIDNASGAVRNLYYLLFYNIRVRIAKISASEHPTAKH